MAPRFEAVPARQSHHGIVTHTDPQTIVPDLPAPTLRRKLGHIAALATDRTVAAIAECLAPDFPRLDAATRAAVLSDVTAFTASQVGALPDFLRYPYRLVLMAFEWLAVPRYGRPFVALDAERRRAWVDLWAESPLGATRNFVKLVRSCALLAFYDHPALQDALRLQAGQDAEPPKDAPSAIDALAAPAPRVGAAS
ncbi:MAG: hypothetical protein IT293_00130 [Deltaproteobacteria bacterium]|nr:hypothetical protein [Deltaproteobacteria bacterium]